MIGPVMHVQHGWLYSNNTKLWGTERETMSAFDGSTTMQSVVFGAESLVGRGKLFSDLLVTSDEAKVPLVGAEWTSILCSGLKGLCAAAAWRRCVGAAGLCFVFQVAAGCFITTRVAWKQRFSCLIPAGLFDSELLYRNSNRTQEGVSGWEAEIITAGLLNMHHENLWEESEIHKLQDKKSVFRNPRQL